ncbi:MAG: YeeE/YedE family protein [SAR324 cluster bacterium]|nr:YeeE/YedE family protein [SAR324 cluster bacterium]
MSQSVNTRMEAPSMKTAFKNGYETLFGQQWPYWVAGVLLGTINVFMFAYARPWSSADGIRNWGDWFFNTVGLADRTIIPPHLFSTSVLNFGIVIGSLAAALFAKQFALRMAPSRELFKGLIGGLLMGIGSSLAFGCNIGGFFSATSALSMAGPAMMLGLMIGAVIGLKLLLFEVEYLSPAVSKRVSPKKSQGADLKKIQPLAGLLVVVIGFFLVFIYDDLDYSERAGILSFGLLIGIIMQRSRFCFVRAFREPFMTGHGDASKAVAIAVIISVTGFSILKWTDLREWETLVSIGFWAGSLVGGIVFGIGMTLAGGCGSGSVWRAGEGHIKLWLALFGFALAGSYSRAWLEDSGWLMKLGTQVFLPDVIGWKLSYISIVGLMLLWYFLATWNEIKGKFVIV